MSIQREGGPEGVNKNGPAHPFPGEHENPHQSHPTGTGAFEADVARRDAEFAAAVAQRRAEIEKAQGGPTWPGEFTKLGPDGRPAK